ncbi:flavodoxin family protein [Vallitalea pronyensis]|uniref:Flavodoxin family protein n=1 Tax=Vallitalea pronyensis TaxID=1348613 RepID=A0A8J8MMC0_9FIRM|nr:flavodoxin family protein [Vallitalea pronyensis]QUI24497.1 flavodoxin family protein [Vallitalea pronyensis]
MKALILNGSRKGETHIETPHSIATKLLEESNYEVTSFLLHELDIKNCIGCYGCWLKTPGICTIDDLGRDIAKSIIQSDLVVYLTPIVFGGVSSELKKVVDRIIPLVLPFFTRVNGEVHHKPRYDKYPRVIVLGVLPQKNEAMEIPFKKLIERNALNWFNPQYSGTVLHSCCETVEIENKIETLIKDRGVKVC